MSFYFILNDLYRLPYSYLCSANRGFFPKDLGPSRRGSSKKFQGVPSRNFDRFPCFHFFSKFHSVASTEPINELLCPKFSVCKFMRYNQFVNFDDLNTNESHAIVAGLHHCIAIVAILAQKCIVEQVAVFSVFKSEN